MAFSNMAGVEVRPRTPAVTSPDNAPDMSSSRLMKSSQTDWPRACRSRREDMMEIPWKVANQHASKERLRPAAPGRPHGLFGRRRRRANERDVAVEAVGLLAGVVGVGHDGHRLDARRLLAEGALVVFIDIVDL